MDNQNRFQRVLLLIPITICMLMAGCGYSFSGSSLPGHIKSIAVPIFENESLDSRIADEMTRGIQESFLQDNRLSVARESQADCVLEGRILNYERRVYSYNASDQPEEYMVVVRVAVVLKDRIKNKDLWSSEAMEGTATYAASGSGSGSSSGDGTESNVVLSNETSARQRCIEIIGQDILANALEQW